MLVRPVADLSPEVPIPQALASAASLVKSISTGLCYSNKVSTKVAEFKGLLCQGVTNLCHSIVMLIFGVILVALITQIET